MQLPVRLRFANGSAGKGLAKKFGSLFGWLPLHMPGKPDAEPSFERWVREYARQMRAQLRKQAGNSRAIDRFARRKSREALRGIRRERPRQLEKDVLVARYRPSPILDRLLPNRESVWVDIMRRQKRERPMAVSLKDFSFLDNADATLAALKALAYVEARELGAVLNFLDLHCQDAGAFLVLAEIYPKLAPVFVGGRMEKPIQKVLNATGVSRNNRMAMQAIVGDQELLIEGKHSDVWAFQLQRRRPALSSRSATVHLDPQAREVAAGRFCDAVDEWLRVPEINQELTKSGRGWLASIIGELLCNAERHSRPASDDGDWSTTAFMVRRTENGQSVLKCHIAFLSVGSSFAQSMQDADPGVRGQLMAYQQRHAACGRSADTLATVFALQDGITCDPSATEGRSGGTGLQDVLEFVAELCGGANGQSDARVTIVSGSSCIALTSSYIPGIRRGEFQPRLQWCNVENSSEHPPLPEVVYDLTEHFAGTLVSVAFTLDPEYLVATVESEDGAND